MTEETLLVTNGIRLTITNKFLKQWKRPAPLTPI